MTDHRIPSPPTVAERAATGVEVLLKPLMIVAGAAGAVAVLLMAGAIFADVVTRNVFNKPIPSTIEFVSLVYMVVLVCFGFATAQRDNDHARVYVLRDKMSRGVRAVWDRVGYGVTAIFVAAMGWFGLESAVHAAQVGEYAPTSGIVVWPLRFVVPLAMAIFLLQLIRDLLRVPYLDMDESGQALESEETR